MKVLWECGQVSRWLARKVRASENTTSLLKRPGAFTQTHCLEWGRGGRTGMGMLSQRKEECLQVFQQEELRLVALERSQLKAPWLRGVWTRSTDMCKITFILGYKVHDCNVLQTVHQVWAEKGSCPPWAMPGIASSTVYGWSYESLHRFGPGVYYWNSSESFSNVFHHQWIDKL